MPNDLNIRPLEQADEAAWRALWTSYLAFYESTVSEAVYRTTFERLTDPGNTQQNAALACLNGTPVGLVHFIVHPHNWRLEDVIYLQDLYADPAVRGSGIGRALIEHVYAFADARETPTVYWLTQEFNTTARQLYDRVATKTDFIKYQR